MEQRQALRTNNTNWEGGQHKIAEVATDGVGITQFATGTLSDRRGRMDEYGWNVGLSASG